MPQNKTPTNEVSNTHSPEAEGDGTASGRVGEAVPWEETRNQDRAWHRGPNRGPTCTSNGSAALGPG